MSTFGFAIGRSSAGPRAGQSPSSSGRKPRAKLKPPTEIGAAAGAGRSAKRNDPHDLEEEGRGFIPESQIAQAFRSAASCATSTDPASASASSTASSWGGGARSPPSRSPGSRYAVEGAHGGLVSDNPYDLQPMMPAHEQRKRLMELSTLKNFRLVKDLAPDLIPKLATIWRVRCSESDIARLCICVVENFAKQIADSMPSRREPMYYS